MARIYTSTGALAGNLEARPTPVPGKVVLQIAGECSGSGVVLNEAQRRDLAAWLLDPEPHVTSVRPLAQQR